MLPSLFTSLLTLLAVQTTHVAAYGCGAHHNGSQNWDVAMAQADEFVAQMTIDEKIAMTQGNTSVGRCVGNIPAIPRLGFGGLCMLDGPSGINRADQVSAFTVVPEGEFTFRAGFSSRDLPLETRFAVLQE